MRAVQIEEFGGPDVLELLEDAPVPEPADGEVLVRVSRGATRQGALRGGLRPVVGTTYPLSEVRRAHEDLAGRRTHGKLLLDPSS